MALRRDWDLNSLRHGIWTMRYEMNHPGNDGFTTWPIKQELYQLKWLIEQALSESSTYSGEAEWLEQQEKQRVWDILNDKMPKL